MGRDKSENRYESLPVKLANIIEKIDAGLIEGEHDMINELSAVGIERTESFEMQNLKQMRENIMAIIAILKNLNTN